MFQTSSGIPAARAICRNHLPKLLWRIGKSCSPFTIAPCRCARRYALADPAIPEKKGF
jgi:hypothetical protein